MKLLRPIDVFLNGITMYRLVMWGLAALAVYSFAASLLGQLSYGIGPLVASWFVLMISCFVFNTLFAKIFHAPTNVESSWITGLILFLTLAPATSLTATVPLLFAAAIAMASKYILAIKKRHIFNPAALALFALSVGGSGAAIWWVGTPIMLPAVGLLGLLVVRKIRRFDALLPFVAVSMVMAAVMAVADGFGVLDSLQTLFLSWPLVFMGTIMLTEPFTMPPSRALRIIYAAIVGMLFSTQFHLGPVYSSPELALLVGNIYSYLVGSRQRLSLTLREVVTLSPGVYEFIFDSSERLKFAAGQYLEWTLPHAKPDTRGNRRYLTVASAPGTNEVRFATRIGEKRSSFKNALLSLTPGDRLSAASVAGDFTLPREAHHPLVFIAGGIGITPFASMLRHMLETKEKRDITLVYAANSQDDFAYRSLIEESRPLGDKPVYLAGERITEETIRNNVPELSKSIFYISGPDIMVRVYRDMLASLGVHKTHIKSDYFPGL